MATYILKKELRSLGIPPLLLAKPAFLPEPWAHMLAPVIWSLGPGFPFHMKNRLQKMHPLMGKVYCICQKFKSALNLYMALFANQLKVVSRRELHCVYWARIFKLLWSARIDSKVSILPAYVAWRTGVRQPYSYSVASPHRLFKNPSTD